MIIKLSIFLFVAVFIPGFYIYSLLANANAFVELEGHGYSDCRLTKGVIGAEDIQLYNGVLFMTGDKRREYTRSGLFSPREYFETLASVPNGGIYYTPLSDPATLQLMTPKMFTLIGYDHPVFHPHGLHVLVDQEDNYLPIYIFVTNHRNDGDAVTIFRLSTDGSPTLIHVESVTHPFLTHVNDVFAVSGTEFFVTNWFASEPGSKSHLFELYTQQYWGNIVHCKKLTAQWHCKVVVDGLGMPNGIQAKDSILFVALSFEKSVKVYKIESDDTLHPTLSQVEQIYIGSFVDNLDVSADHSELASVKAPSQVHRIVIPKDPGVPATVQELYLAQGLEQENMQYLSASSIAVCSECNSPKPRIFIGAVFDDGILTCRVDKSRMGVPKEGEL